MNNGWGNGLIHPGIPYKQDKYSTMDSTLIVILSALISGLLATMVTILWHRKTETRDKKMRIFETLMADRYMTSSQECVHAFNSIDVIFYKDKNVRRAYADFLNETEKQPRSISRVDDKYLKLLEEIAGSLGLKAIHWDDIKRTYYPDRPPLHEKDEIFSKGIHV